MKFLKIILGHLEVLIAPFIISIIVVLWGSGLLFIFFPAIRNTDMSYYTKNLWVTLVVTGWPFLYFYLFHQILTKERD